MSFKFNPFTANFSLVEDKIERSGAVWVDNIYGNDSTGKVERQDLPFATINAAWDAMATHPRRNNCVFYLRVGTHTLSATLSDATWGNATRNVTIICEGTPQQTIINSAVADRMIWINSSGGTSRNLTIDGGTWNRTGITGSIMFDVSSSDSNEFILKNANVNDSGGTNGIAFQRSVQLIYNCLITCTNNSYVFVGSGPATSDFKMERCKVDAPTTSAFFSSTTLSSFIIADSYINIPTGIIGTVNGNISATVINSLIDHSGVALDGRALVLNARDTKFRSITNNQQISFDTVSGANSLRADGLYLERPDTATSNCISRTGTGIVKAYIYGKGLYYSERTPPAGGSDPSTTNTGPNGRVGCRLAATVTIGNQITMNLTNTIILGTAYNTQPLTHTFTTTNTATELAAMKAVIDAQVIIPGTTWYRWTQGDTSLVRIVGNDIYIIAHPLCPDYYRISTTTNYFSETIPGNIVTDANLAPNGIVDVIGGPQYPLIDVEQITGNGGYPETLIGPILNLRTL